MLMFDARTLAAALAAIALGAPAATAEDYMVHIVPPCATCNTIPKPHIPDILGQHPKFGTPDRRAAEQAPLRTPGPGAPSTQRLR